MKMEAYYTLVVWLMAGTFLEIVGRPGPGDERRVDSATPLATKTDKDAQIATTKSSLTPDVSVTARFHLKHTGMEDEEAPVASKEDSGVSGNDSLCNYNGTGILHARECDDGDEGKPVMATPTAGNDDSDHVAQDEVLPTTAAGNVDGKNTQQTLQERQTQPVNINHVGTTIHPSDDVSGKTVPLAIISSQKMDQTVAVQRIMSTTNPILGSSVDDSANKASDHTDTTLITKQMFTNFATSTRKDVGEAKGVEVSSGKPAVDSRTEGPADLSSPGMTSQLPLDTEATTIWANDNKQSTWVGSSLEKRVYVHHVPAIHGLVWEDRQYMLSVLVPIGCGMLGAIVIVLLAYALRNCSCQPRPASFNKDRNAVKVDHILLLEDTSDDER